MARPSTHAKSCRDAVRALAGGRWPEWQGLPDKCSLASVARGLGGSEVLDFYAMLGSEKASCTRSALNDAPAIVWHDRDAICLIECDLLGAAVEPPDLCGADVHRLDIHWGAAFLQGGEAVIPSRGLALILTSGGMAVGCRGFSPMPIEQYIARRRPRDAARRPMPAAGPAR